MEERQLLIFVEVTGSNIENLQQKKRKKIYSQVLNITLQHEALHLGIIFVEATICNISVKSPY